MDHFPTLLRSYRDRRGISRNAACKEIGIDPSYWTRCEAGDRASPRQHIVEAMARVLRLTVPERNRLVVAAGYAPVSLVDRGWCATLQAVSDVLDDTHLNEEERETFSHVICEIAARWRSVGASSVRFAS